MDGDASNFLPNLCDIGQDRVRCPDSVHTNAPGFLDELPILDHVESIGHFNRTLNTTFIYINGTSCNSRGMIFFWGLCNEISFHCTACPTSISFFIEFSIEEFKYLQAGADR